MNSFRKRYWKAASLVETLMALAILGLAFSLASQSWAQLIRRKPDAIQQRRRQMQTLLYPNVESGSAFRSKDFSIQGCNYERQVKPHPIAADLLWIVVHCQCEDGFTETQQRYAKLESLYTD